MRYLWDESLCGLGITEAREIEEKTRNTFCVYVSVSVCVYLGVCDFSGYANVFLLCNSSTRSPVFSLVYKFRMR